MELLEKIIQRHINKRIIDREEERLKKKKEAGSFREIVFGNRPCQQAHNIRLGLVTEDTFSSAAAQGNNNFQLMDKDKIDVDGKTKQLDVFLINEIKKIIDFFESKNNINLDTEKSPATAEKVLGVKAALEKEYPGYEVRARILTARYPTVDDAPATFLNKEGGLSENNVIGYNEYFNLVGYPTCSREEWEKMWFNYGTYILEKTEEISKKVEREALL